MIAQFDLDLGAYTPDLIGVSMHYLYVLKHHASGLHWLGKTEADPRKHPPTVTHWKWLELLAEDPRTVLKKVVAYRSKEKLSSSLRQFKSENQVSTTPDWVNSDCYKDTNSPYVYLIVHRETGQFYLGSRYANTANPSKFFKDYFTSSRRVKELGYQNFDIEWITACRGARHLERKLLKRWYTELGPQKFMQRFLNRNLAPGILLDANSIEKMRASKLRNSRKGISHTEEHRANISRALLGHKHSPETLVKLRESARRRKPRKHSEETKAKMRAAAARRPPPSEATREKIRAARTGTKASIETRNLLSATHKARYEADPKLKDRISRKLKKTHRQDPSIAARMSESARKSWETRKTQQST